MLPVVLALFAAFAEEPTAPEVSLQGFVLRPTFEIDSVKTPAGGLCFVVDEGEARYAVSAYQLLGAPSGIATVPSAQVPKKVSRVILGEADTNTWLANTAPPLKIEMEVVGQTATRDVLVAPIPTAKDKTATLSTQERATVQPRKLAAEAPKKGEAVWLVAPLPNSPDAGALHRGTVAEINGDFLFYDVANRDLNLAGTSGAPLVNAAGEIVGMQVGVIQFEDGALAGSAVPLDALKARIAEGAAKAAK